MIISEILAWSARQWPDMEFIVEIDPVSNTRRSLTYRQFDQRVNMVANALLDAGIKKGDMVLHFLRNRIEWIEAYFGIIRLGAIVVPLNFRFTSAEVKYAADVVKSSLIIFEEQLADVITPIRSSLTTVKDYICIGKNIPSGTTDYERFIANHPVTQPNIQISEEDDLGLYFTSGTTGLPKPILLTHKNLYARTVSNGVSNPLPPHPNTVIYSPLFHAGPFFLWLPSLFWGGKCMLLLRFRMHDFLKTIEQEKVTAAGLALPHCVDFITAQKRGEINVTDYDLSSWRYLIIGAQPYPTGVIRDLVNLFPTVGIRYGFGISEGGGATLTILGPDEILRRLGSVGKASALVDCRVVNDEGKDVAPGEVGELIVKTESMMKEYYKNPEETTKTIRDGWLYTGDLAKIDGEGYIYIVDRKKDVIVSGGENVYPVEVEEVLMTHPKIQEAAVIGIPDERFGERVAAVVTLKPGENMTKDELLEWCKEKFPTSKRPRQIEFGDISKSQTHKVLKPDLRLRYSGKKAAF